MSAEKPSTNIEVDIDTFFSKKNRHSVEVLAFNRKMKTRIAEIPDPEEKKKMMLYLGQKFAADFKN